MGLFDTVMNITVITIFTTTPTPMMTMQFGLEEFIDHELSQLSPSIEAEIEQGQRLPNIAASKWPKEAVEQGMSASKVSPEALRNASEALGIMKNHAQSPEVKYADLADVISGPSDSDYCSIREFESADCPLGSIFVAGLCVPTNSDLLNLNEDCYHALESLYPSNSTARFSASKKCDFIWPCKSTASHKKKLFGLEGRPCPADFLYLPNSNECMSYSDSTPYIISADAVAMSLGGGFKRRVDSKRGCPSAYTAQMGDTIITCKAEVESLPSFKILPGKKYKHILQEFMNRNIVDAEDIVQGRAF